MNRSIIRGLLQDWLKPELQALSGAQCARCAAFRQSFTLLGAWLLLLFPAQAQATPPNDNFADATTLVGQSGSLNWTTTGATKELNEPNHGGNAGGHSVWYRWTPTVTGQVSFNLFGSSFDTLLAVYTGSAVDALTLVTQNDDFIPGQDLTSSVTFSAQAGTVYRIAVDGYAGASGGFILNWFYPQVTDTFTANDHTNYTAFVINADAANPAPSYQRDTIRFRTTVRSVNNSASGHWSTFSLRYRLLDTNQVPHPIHDFNGVTNAAYTYSIVTNFVLAGSGSATNTLEARLRPAARLNPYMPYRVEVTVVRGSLTSAGPVLADQRFFYHFTNTVETDPALNVISLANAPSWTRLSAVKTVPGKSYFLANASFYLVRYDNFITGPNMADPVPVRLIYQLRNAATGSIIPLKVTQTNFTENVLRYQLGSIDPVAPNVHFNSRQLVVEPLDSEQLDPVNGLYQLWVTIAHTDLAGQPITPGNTMISAADRLLHFNGHLLFGGIDTLFSQLGNIPTLISVAPGFVRSTLAVTNQAGQVVGHPNHTYGNGAPLAVLLRPNGNAELTSGSVGLTLTLPGLDLDSAAGIWFWRDPITLSPSGASAGVWLILPAGLGYTADTSQRYLESIGYFPNQPLAQNLAPAVDPVFNATLWICEETKPFWVEVSSIRWEVAAGRFVMTPTSAIQYVRGNELAALEAAPVPAEMKIKRSNEQYFRALFRVLSPTLIVTPDPVNGSARLSLEVSFASGQFRTHVPYDALVGWGTGLLTVANDRVDPNVSRLSGVLPVQTAYNRDCPGQNCPGPKAGPAVLTLLAEGGELTFTRDGGLGAGGLLSTAQPLTWGFQGPASPDHYAHQTEPRDAGRFLMAGTFLSGADTSLPRNDRAAALLLSGFDPNDLNQAERPTELAYEEDYQIKGDYAGMNFRAADTPPVLAESRLGGSPTGPYELTGRSQYYARWGGVNGVHNAVPETFPDTLVIYGYTIRFRNFGLSFLDSRNDFPPTASVTEGQVELPFPANITNNFDELRFTCLGDLADAKVPPNEADLYKQLTYWQADFITQAIKFDRADGCVPGQGWLVLGVKAHATYVDDPLYGAWGFKPNGSLIAFADNLLPDFGSRLKMPAEFKLKGPAQESYRIVPVADAYLNRDALHPGGPGFMNIGAKVDLPFFEDLQTHIHTGARTNDANAVTILDMMGGWPHQSSDPDLGFTDVTGHHFFNQPAKPDYFDPGNAGYPAPGQPFLNTAANVAAYRDPATEMHNPRAQRTWAEVIDFDYPLVWDPPSRSFRSLPNVETSLLFLNVENRVKYLSAEHAELKFGIFFDSVPAFNIANLAFNEIDADKGVVQAFADAALGPVREQIEGALGSMDDVLDSSPRDFFKGAFDDKLQPKVGELYDRLATDWPNIQTALNDYLTVAPSGQSYPIFSTQLQNLYPSLAADLDADLGEVWMAITNSQLIFKETPLTTVLIRELIGEFAANLAGSIGDDKIQAYLEKEAASALKEIDVTALTLRGQTLSFQDRLQPGQDFYAELQGKLWSSQGIGDIGNLLGQARQDVADYFATFDPNVDDPFNPALRSQVEKAIRKRLEDRFFAAPLSASLQTVLRQRLYEFDGALRDTIDSGFQQLNLAIRELANEVFALLDNKLDGLLGDLKSVIAAGKLDGYAHIKGDSLNLLRLDGQVRWKVPSSMELGGFFQIKELNSDGSGTTCAAGGGPTPEVSFGANASSVSWLGKSISASANAKFAFQSQGSVVVPINFAGGVSFAAPEPTNNFNGKLVTQGGIDFAMFNLNEFKAALAFGQLENYISGSARIYVNGYEGAGGLFLGSTCTLDPIQLWDPQVAETLGTPNPSFTGIYGYAEAWMPVLVNAGCALRIRAGLGAGAFYFEEGPTYGAVALVGASGEALCVVDVKGTIKMVGVKNPDGITLNGQGKVKGSVDLGFTEISASIPVKGTYQDGNWKFGIK